MGIYKNKMQKISQIDDIVLTFSLFIDFVCRVNVEVMNERWL